MMVFQLLTLFLGKKLIEVEVGHKDFRGVLIPAHLCVRRIKEADALVVLAMLPDAVVAYLPVTLFRIFPACKQ